MNDHQPLTIADLHLRTLLDASPVGMLVVNHREEVILANPVAKRLFGFLAQDGPTQRCGDVVRCANRLTTERGCGHADPCPNCSLFRGLKTTLSGTAIPADLEGEAYLNREPGCAPLWIRFTIRPLLIDGKQGALLTVDDITAKRLSEERYTMLFREMLNAFALHEIICDDQGRPNDYRFLAVNPAFERMTGLPAEQIIGHTVLEVLPGIESFWIETYGRVALTGEPASFEHYSQEIGKYFAIHAFCPSPGQFACLFEDITQRKVLIEQSRDGIVILNHQGRAQEANQRFADMLGCTREEVQCLHVWDWDARWTREQLLEAIAHIDAAGDFFETTHRRKDGTTFPVEISTNGSLWNGEKLVFCICRDISERKRAEQQLRQSRDFLHTLLNAIPARVFWKDLDLKYLGCNLAFAQDAGCNTPEELIGKDDFALAWQDQAPWYQSIDREIITHGTTKMLFEESQTTPSGEQIHLLTSKLPLKNTEGATIGVLGVYTDITERKKAEEALKDASVRVSLATKAGGVGVWEYDLINNRLQWDEQMYALYGTSRDAFDGAYESWRAGVHPEDIDRCDQEVEMALYGEKEFGTEFRVVWPDGTVRHIQALAMVLRDADGKPLRMIGTNWDITVRKRVEESLKESEERFKALHNASFGGIAIHDQGVILECNQGLSEITGFSNEELIGMDGLLLISEKTRGKVLKNIRDGYEKPYEAIGLRKNNDEYPVRLEARNIPYRGKKVRVVEFRDITEAKQTEVEREKLQTQLQQAQKMEAIGTLAGGIAHDFNNILGAVIGYTEMAREESPRESLAAKYMDKVLEASNRARNLVKQILAFSRQENIESVLLAPETIVREAAALLRPSLPTTIAIKVEVESGVSAVMADPTQLHQIVINLATNAFHAMETTGGTLRLSLTTVDWRRQPPQAFPESRQGLFVCLAVEDTGPGIPAAVRERIFEPFFTTKEVGRGTGMGLATVHGIVKKFGGFITCESEPGHGATFRVFLPAIAGGSTSQPPQEETVGFDRAGKDHILFVDDEHILVEMGQTLIERLGYEVTTSTSSLEALTTFQNDPHRFDAVITDQTMPGMTGLELARRMLQIRADLPIILCTGYSNLVDEAQAKAWGIKGFAMKPLTKKEIAALLREVLTETTSTTPGKEDGSH